MVNFNLFSTMTSHQVQLQLLNSRTSRTRVSEKDRTSSTRVSEKDRTSSTRVSEKDRASSGTTNGHSCDRMGRLIKTNTLRSVVGRITEKILRLVRLAGAYSEVVLALPPPT